MNLTFVSIIVLEVVFLGGMVTHLDYFNGSPYWQWKWRQISYLRTASYLSLPLILYIYALFKTETVKDQIGPWKILPLTYGRKSPLSSHGNRFGSRFFRISSINCDVEKRNHLLL